MREILEFCNDTITQGTIFFNARCNECESSYGVFINGRCDIENRHFDSYMYLPIIPFEEWKLNGLVKKILKEKHTDVIRVLQKYKDIFSYEALPYLHEHEDEIIDKHIKKECDRKLIRKSLYFINVFNIFKRTSIVPKELVPRFLDLFAGDVSAGKEKLLENNLSDCFYLENVDIAMQKRNESTHFVILLTEVHSLPRIALDELTVGISLDEEFALRPFFGTDSIAMACANIKSPYIEYIVQKFTNLFRVGINRADNFDMNTKGGM